MLGRTALVLLNDIPSDSQDTKKITVSLAATWCKNSKGIISNFDPLFPFPTSSSAISRSGPLVLRNVSEPQAVSAGSLFTVPSHFHLLDISSSLPATTYKSKEVSRLDGNFVLPDDFVSQIENQNTDQDVNQRNYQQANVVWLQLPGYSGFDPKNVRTHGN